jgi:hypothetical protein
MVGAAIMSGVPPLGLPKNQQLRIGHFHTDFCGFSTVIDQRENSDALFAQHRFEPIDRSIDGVPRGLADDSVACSRRCGSRAHFILLVLSRRWARSDPN